MRFANLAAAAVSLTLVTLAACGRVTPTCGEGVVACADGGPDDTPDGGARGDGGGDGGGACVVAPLDGRRACVPGVAAEGTPLTLELDAPDGCTGCLTTLEPCKVSVDGQSIRLAMEAKTCPAPSSDFACPAVCGIPKVSCTLPPLAAGTYDVDVAGEGARPGLAPRQLVVTAEGSATSCTLPSPGTPPAPVDGTKYPTSCSTDADCAVVTVGDVCTPCRCPNAAISTLAVEGYAAEYRARVSECAGDLGGLVCAGCAAVKAVCKVDGTSLTGTCALGPAS